MILLAGALALAVPQVALAGDSEDFAGCDGMRKPKRDEDGMRGMANQTDYGRLRISHEGAPARVIAYCTGVLQGDRIRDHQSLRRAHVLRARAAAYIQTGAPAHALGDIAEARLNVADRSDDPFFQRSMGLSLDLLEAVALAQSGDAERAGEIARAAKAERPYALQVQLVANQLENFAEVEYGPSHGLMKIHPSVRQQSITSLVARGEFAAAIAQGEEEGLFAAPPTAEGEAALAALLGEGGGERALLNFVSDIVTRAHLAYALAATGELDRAQSLVEQLRAMQDPGSGNAAVANVMAVLLKSEPMNNPIALAEARLAIATGDASRAAALMAASNFGESAMTRDLQAAFSELEPSQENAADTQIAAPELRVSSPDMQRSTDHLRRLAYPLLFPPETVRSVIDYERSRPNILGAVVGGVLTMGTSLLGGIDRLAGFRSTANEDGTITVEFAGDTISGPMVQEMTLLRAAELASEAEMPYFEIVQRQDSMRYMVQTQYGVEINRVPTGFKTVLVVRFHEDAEASDFLLNAVGVIDSLGPLYYEEA
ncbi:hypothetical protein [Aurantiacibacter poecillastricola]|uniref:hypothetical protein n=1 Tax=Aurantiacibacter poecillastricola TaxID=3064385 RepID=UPI00273DC5F6|nr:hypothetical protein [Aurantiacibacter sp. 219JJ12-13]MDP5260299.1 hypothetical protein [Aurantiacibacter sp. 219JJ12-13]